MLFRVRATAKSSIRVIPTSYTDVVALDMLSRLVLLSVVFLVCGSGCREETHPPDGSTLAEADRRSGDTEGGPTTAPAGPEPTKGSFYGNWQVTAFYFGRIHAMDEDQASKWIGAKARYAPDMARFEGPDGVEHCTNPSYSYERIRCNQFYGRFGRHAQDLGFTRETITLVDITHRNDNWIAPGSFLILKSPDSIITMWDGIFFELSRR